MAKFRIDRISVVVRCPAHIHPPQHTTHSSVRAEDPKCHYVWLGNSTEPELMPSQKSLRRKDDEEFVNSNRLPIQIA